MKRPAQFAGSWYPAEKESVTKYLNSSLKIRKALGIVAPHAGYTYSGKVAGDIYSQIEIPENVIILSPNHSGLGPAVSLMAEGSWETPFGEIEINQEFSQKILNKCPLVKNDTSAHLAEHSIELQLPFLKIINANFKLIPITLQQISFEDCQTIAQSLASLIKESYPNTLIVASSDFSHGENLEDTEKKDKLAISEIEDLNPQGLYETVVNNSISMCGFIGTVIMLATCKLNNAKKCTLHKYTNSHEITGDESWIVGYAGLTIE